MYDILQLNDMLVPELLDIAEQLKIPNAKKLDKQELVYKILDKQAVLASAVKTNPNDDKGKRKRIVKTSTANSTEEADVVSGDEKPRKEVKREAPKKKIEKPAPPKKGAARRKPEVEEEEVAPMMEEEDDEQVYREIDQPDGKIHGHESHGRIEHLIEPGMKI